MTQQNWHLIYQMIKLKRDDTVGLKDAQGNIRTATFGESRKDLIKKFINRK